MIQNRTRSALTESELAERIEKMIRGRTGGTIYGLSVEVLEDRSVVISGQTATYYNKQLATHAAQSASDDCQLMNQIEVS